VANCSLLIKRLEGYESLPLPNYHTEFAAGMDLCANFSEEYRGEGLSIPVQGRAIITTGLCIEIPPNYEGQIRSRSGLAANNGIVVLNSPGTVDADFRGHLRVILANFGDQDFLIQQGNRIAQLVISPILRPNVQEVKDLNDSDRGAKGFGSTGMT
tara:strand:- start:21 stop:488 length:468 start_codon:yes stop_codon:yes gene_type:complete